MSPSGTVYRAVVVRRRTAVCLLLVAASLFASSVTAPASSDLPIEQRVCFNVHMNYGGAYGNITGVKSALDYLGTDCIRDTLPPDHNLTDQPLRWNQLGKQVIAICGGYFQTWRWEGTESTCVSEARSRVQRLVAIEGMNEPYCGDDNGLRANAQRLHDHMQRIENAVGTGSPQDAYSVALCQPDWWPSSIAPVAGMVNNMHSYSEPGQWPYLDPATDTHTLAWWMAQTRLGDAGYAATEIGRNLSSFNGDHTIHARVQLVHILNHLYKGVKRFALYQLADETGDTEGWGMYDSLLNKRKAADAIHNLLSVIGDAKTADPAGFSYTVSDPASTALSLSMADATGKTYIALWNRQSTATRNVTLNLSAARSIGIVRPVTGSTVESRASRTSHSISLGDDPVLVRVDASA
jgi:hypothetical protein